MQQVHMMEIYLNGVRCALSDMVASVKKVLDLFNTMPAACNLSMTFSPCLPAQHLKPILIKRICPRLHGIQVNRMVNVFTLH